MYVRKRKERGKRVTPVRGISNLVNQPLLIGVAAAAAAVSIVVAGGGRKSEEERREVVVEYEEAHAT